MRQPATAGDRPRRGRLSISQQAFLALVFLAILTLWAPGLLPAALFLCGTFLLTIVELFEERRIRASLLLVLTLPLWELLQILFHWPVYVEPARFGLLASLSYGCVVFLVTGIPGERVEAVRLAMLWFAFLVAVEAILQRVSGGNIFWTFEPSDARGYFMGPILYHNHWAVFVEISLPVAIYHAVGTKTGSLWLYSTIGAVLYASVVISASRSGAIICSLQMVAVPMLVAYRHRLREGSIKAVAPLAGALVLCTLIVGPEVLLERLQSDPTTGRIELDRSSLVMIRDHMWRGIGIGGWPVVYPQFATFGDGTFVNQAHNDWLQWFAEGGIFYGGAFLGLAGISWRQAWRFPWAAGVPAVFCQALVDYPFSRPALAAWTFTMFGLACGEVVSRPKSTH